MDNRGDADRDAATQCFFKGLFVKVDEYREGSLVGSARMNARFVSLVATQTVQT